MPVSKQIIPKPTIGRTVNYHFDNGSGVVILPAIVVYVFPSNKSALVNLQVLHDGPRGAYWATSVPYGFKHNCWTWPSISREEIEVLPVL